MGIGVQTTPSRMEKHKAVDYLRFTGLKITKRHVPISGNIGPLARSHLYDVSLAGRWWPVLVTGYRFSMELIPSPHFEK